MYLYNCSVSTSLGAPDVFSSLNLKLSCHEKEIKWNQLSKRRIIVHRCGGDHNDEPHCFRANKKFGSQWILSKRYLHFTDLIDLGYNSKTTYSSVLKKKSMEIFQISILKRYRYFRNTSKMVAIFLFWKKLYMLNDLRIFL